MSILHPKSSPLSPTCSPHSPAQSSSLAALLFTLHAFQSLRPTPTLPPASPPLCILPPAPASFLPKRCILFSAPTSLAPHSNISPQPHPGPYSSLCPSQPCRTLQLPADPTPQGHAIAPHPSAHPYPNPTQLHPPCPSLPYPNPDPASPSVSAQPPRLQAPNSPSTQPEALCPSPT